MYVPVTLGQPAGALAPVAIASTAPPAIKPFRTALKVHNRQLDVLNDHRVTVAGALLDGPRSGLSGRVVVLQALGRHGWSTLTRARTGTRGRFRLSYVPHRIGSEWLRLRFAGDARDLAAHRRLGRLNVFRLAAASWYGGGGSLACGGSLTSNTLGVANKTLPCGTLVTLRYGGRSLRVPVIDRGPYVAGREFDLTEATKQALGFGDTGEERITEYQEENGYWSVTTAEDIHTVSRDWRTYSSEAGGVTAVSVVFPLELTRAMFIGMDPPKHDRLKALFQAGFTPKRIADHEDEIRAIAVDVLDRLDGRQTCDLVTDIAQPFVSRVIGSFMGIPKDDDAVWAGLMNSALGAGDVDLNPEGIASVVEKDIPEIFERCRRLIAERQENPTDDLTSVLVHAEVDGEKLEEHEIVMGFFLLVAAGNDSTKATYCSGMRALMENPEQMQLLLEDPALVPGAVEEALRMFPAFAHFRRTATRDTELHGQKIKEGEKVVMWYVSSNRDETRYQDPDRFDVRRNADHQAFGAGGRHFCLGTALARLELKVLFEETLQRYPQIALAGTPVYVESPFINQLKTLPVTLAP
jgi:cholest-4-en-3-one 26-monooxygenase